MHHLRVLHKRTDAPLAITFRDHWHMVAFAAGQDRAKFLNTKRNCHTLATRVLCKRSPQRSFLRRGTRTTALAVQISFFTLRTSRLNIICKKFNENRHIASDHLWRSLVRGGVCCGFRSCQVLEHKPQLPYISNICGYSTNEALHAEWHARLHMPCNLYTQDFTTPSQSLVMMDK